MFVLNLSQYVMFGVSGSFMVPFVLSNQIMLPCNTLQFLLAISPKDHGQ